MFNEELLIRAVNHIKSHPDTWNQRQWHCGTTHCIGGWIEMFVLNPSASAPEQDFLRTSNYSEISRRAMERLFDIIGYRLDISNMHNFPWGEYTEEVARKALGITEGEADRLFRQYNNLVDIRWMSEDLILKYTGKSVQL